MSLNDRSMALAAHDRAVSIWQGIYGTQLPDYLCDSMGDFYLGSGELDKAIKSYERALSLQDNSRVAFIHTKIARIRHTLGQ